MATVEMEAIVHLLKKVERLEKLVKEHLPCPHESKSKAWTNGNDWQCDDCGIEWAGDNPPPLQGRHCV